MKDFLTLAKERYSVRSYAPRAVEEEKLQKVLEAGYVAPTAKNTQPFRVYVVRSESARAKLAELSPCTFGAPIVLMFVKRTDEECANGFEPEFKAGVEDVSIVADHMMMEATDLGLGTCWVNYFPPMATAKAFGLPAEEIPVLLMPLGYAAENSVPAGFHTMYRDRDLLIREL